MVIPKSSNVHIMPMMNATTCLFTGAEPVASMEVLETVGMFCVYYYIIM